MVGLRPALGVTFGSTGDSIAKQTMLINFSPENSASNFGLVFSLSSQQQGDLGIVITPIGSTALSKTINDWQIDANLSAAISGFAISPTDFTFPTGF